jgi:hypothetical protein
VPIYTYECEQGHRWEEFWNTHEGSEVSKEPCASCLEAADRLGVELEDEMIRDYAGRKVPSKGVRAIFRGIGWTPTFNPNQRGNK